MLCILHLYTMCKASIPSRCQLRLCAWPLKVETIGDAYMAVTNLVDPDPYHAATMVRFALRAQEEAAKVPRPDTDDGSMLSLRIGEGREWSKGR